MYIENINQDKTYTINSVNLTEQSSGTTTVQSNMNKVSVFENYFDKTNSYDGKIDDSKQQEIGNCYLLSELKSLSNTDFGVKAIKDSIDYNHTGSEIDPYTVTIYNSFGEKQTIEVTKADIEKYLKSDKNYSIGDGDTRLIEAATAKYFIQEIEAGRMTGRSIDDPLEGSPFGVYSTNYMITGKLPHGITSVEIASENQQYYDELTNKNLNDVLNKYADNPNNMAMTVSFKDRTFFQKLFGTVNKEQQESNHCYAITGIKRDNSENIVSITYTNPHNSSVEYTIPYDKFQKIVTQIDYVSGND